MHRTLVIASQLMLVAAVIAAAVGLWRLATATSGLSVTEASADGMPVTVFAPAAGGPAPVVVIAHGFAGSQQLMQPFAISLARSGSIAVTYDLLGHGRNPKALTGDVAVVEGATATLIRQLDAVVAFARGLPGSDGRLALLGHSMATDVIIRYAIGHPDVAATVAVSMFSPAVTASAPRNMLVVVGDWEAGLKGEALRAVGLAAGGEARPGVTYGDLADGTARRAEIAPDVEHVGVLYSGASLAAARDWLAAVFGRTSAAPVDRRGLSLALYFIGMMVVARFATRLLPRVAVPPVGADASWRSLAAIGLMPAVLSPLILWKAPVDGLPIPVGGYLAMHFLVYGILTAAGLAWRRRRAPRRPAGLVSRGKLVLAAGAVTLFCLAAFYWPIDAFVTSFVPTAGRWLLVAVLVVGLFPYFLADEWLTRGGEARRGAYLATKLCFLLSLAAAIALDPDGLLFLIILVPVITLFFTLFGLISSWVYQRTGHPAVAAAANAILIATAIGVTFPILGR